MRFASTGLVVAAVIVGLAIVIGGATARILNPIGALLWVGSGVFVARSLPAAERPVLGWIAALASGVVLGGIVRPGNLPEAVIGFGIAGLLSVLAAGDRSGVWALLAPSVYLPVHLAIGIGRALMQGAGMRTDPPPTAAILPLAMVLAAAAGGAVGAALMRRRH
jgi:hypothetical protein